MTDTPQGAEPQPAAPVPRGSSNGGWKAFILNAFLWSTFLWGGFSCLEAVSSSFVRGAFSVVAGMLSLSAGGFALLSIFLIGSFKRLPWRPFAPLLGIFIWQGCLYLPLPAYVSWSSLTLMGALADLAMGGWAMVRLSRIPSNGRPWLTTSLVADCPYSARRTVLATLLKLLLLLPVMLIYLFLSAQLCISHLSNGFLTIKLNGLFTEARTYEKDGHQVFLLPTVHIAAPSFYDHLMESHPAEESVILPEGVTDQNNLMKAKLDYSGVAGAVGLSSQPSLTAKRENPEIRRYDADISDFSKPTIIVLNGIGRAMQAGISGDTAAMVEALSNLQEPDTALLISDILDTRNSRLLKGIETELSHFKYIAVPWGVAHMPGIERGLLKLNMKTIQRRQVKVFGWNDLSLFPEP
jgi:hypothetical protein